MITARRILVLGLIAAGMIGLLLRPLLIKHRTTSLRPIPSAYPPSVAAQPSYRLDDSTTVPAPVDDPEKTPAKADAVKRWAAVAGLDVVAIKSLRAGDPVVFPLMDGKSAHGRVNLARTDPSGAFQIGGSLDDGGSFALGVSGASLTGFIRPAKTTSVYILAENAGRAYLLEKDAGTLLCVNLPPVDLDRITAAAAATDASGSATSETAAAVPVLSSRPTATTVIYLDFDGETVTDTAWNSGTTITAAASGLTTTQITEVWRRVAEDYKAFNVDVTTDLSRYNAVAATYRMRCIITGDDWYYTAYGQTVGGVAYVSSWKNSGGGSYSSTIPCWVFSGNLASTARYVAEAAAHEIGHTLGLSHDGLRDSSGTTTNAYYTGRGSGATGWAPIMGVGYYVNLVQFSKGEYSDGSLYANNTEDDLALIVATATPMNRTTNHVSYIADSVAATTASATALAFTSSTTLGTTGLIETTGDSDMYSFTAAAGTYTFNLVTEDASLTGLQNADTSLVLYDASGNTVGSSNPESSTLPSLAATLAAGTYYLKITGVGEGSATSGYYASGYSSYGSIGRYQLSGTAVLAPVITSATADSGAVGTVFSYTITADNSPVSFAASTLPDGLTLNTDTGVISGTPAASGQFTLTLSATNTGGTGTATLVLTIETALDAWLASYSIVDLSADPDGDGMVNLVEYAYGLDPSSASASTGLPYASLVTENDLTYPAITFTIPSGRDALLYLVQLTYDCTVWSDGHSYGTGADNTGSLPTVESSNALQSDGSRLITVRSATSLTEQSRAFFRVKITAR